MRSPVNLLIHIGYHKTASSFLQQSLFGSAEAGFRRCVDDRTLVNTQIAATNSFYTVEDWVTREVADQAERASDQGLTLVMSHERLSGYPASGGYDSKLIADRLGDCFPGARILIVIREQRSFIRSMYSQYVTDGGDQSLERFLEPPEPHLRRVPGWDFLFLEYDRLIAHYQSLFGSENVLVLPFEHLRADADDFVLRIVRFGGRSDAVPPVERDAVNRKRPLTLQWVTRLANRNLVHSQLSPHGPAPASLARPILLRLARPFEALTPSIVEAQLAHRIEGVVEEAVGTRFTESNQRTSELIGWDLARLGYA